MHSIKNAFDEPNLITFGIERPCSTKDDNLNFVGGMAGVVVTLQAGVGLQVGIKAVLFSTLSTGFIRQVAFGHPNVVGAENTFTGARIGLGQNRNRSDTRTGTDRFAA